MKKILCAMLSIAFLSCCTACDNKVSKTSENSEAPINVESVSRNFQRELENCKNKDYVNLNFADCSASRLPEFDECFNIEVSSISQTMSNKEIINKFEKFCEYYIGEYEPEYMFFYSSDPSLDVELPNMIDENGIEYRGRTKISDYIDRLENDDLQIYDVEYLNIEKHQYLWWIMQLNSSPHWVNKGTAYDLLNDNTIRISSWIPSDIGDPIAVYFNDGNHDDVSYMLTDGEVTIGEAIRYFEDDFFSTLPVEKDEKYSLSVNSVNVYETAEEGIYCYNIIFSPAWNSVSFENMGEFISYSNHDQNAYTMNCQALIVKKNEIDTVLYAYFPAVKAVGEPITELYSLEAAADIVSEKLSNAVMFDVQSVDMIYCGSYEGEERKVALLKPTWRFILFNTNDNINYCVYVDGASGECSYFSYRPI